jgi:hypothetical protein
MAALVLRWTGDWIAAALAGVLYAFAPVQIASAAWLHVLATFCLPLALLAFDRLVSPGRAWGAAALLWAVLAWQVTIGVYMSVFAVGLVLVYAATHLAAVGAPRPWRRLGLGALAAVAVVPVLVPLVTPYLAASPLAHDAFDRGALLSRQGASLFSLDPLATPAELGRRLMRLLGIVREAPAAGAPPLAVDVGRPALALAVLGLLVAAGPSRRERARVLALGACLLVGVALALGPGFLPTPLGTIPLPLVLLTELPVVGGLRTPERWMLVALVAAAALAGLALARLLRDRPAWLRLALAAAVVALVHADAGAPAMRAIPPLRKTTAVDRLLAASGGTPLLEWPIVAPLEVAARRTLESVRHWQPTTTCFTSVYPPLWFEVAERMMGVGRAEEFAPLIERLGIGWILVHRGELPLPPAFAAAAGARLVDEDAERTLWARDGGRDVRAEIGRLDRSWDGTSRAPLAPQARRADLVLDLPAAVAAGGQVEIVAHVTNRGPERWPATGAPGPGLVRLRVGWRTSAGDPVPTLRDPRRLAVLARVPARWQAPLRARNTIPDRDVALGPDVGPGERRTVRLATRAPAAAGDYRLVAALGQNGDALELTDGTRERVVALRVIGPASRPAAVHVDHGAGPLHAGEGPEREVEGVDRLERAPRPGTERVEPRDPRKARGDRGERIRGERQRIAMVHHPADAARLPLLDREPDRPYRFRGERRRADRGDPRRRPPHHHHGARGHVLREPAARQRPRVLAGEARGERQAAPGRNREDDDHHRRQDEPRPRARQAGGERGGSRAEDDGERREAREEVAREDDRGREQRRP